MKDKKRKYWLFYIINKDVADRNNAFVNDIYAFTDSIDIAENFINTRNMSVFYTKTEKLSASDVKELIRHYMTCELEIFSGTTRTNKYKLNGFKIALTRRERQFVQTKASLTLHEEIYQYVWKNVNPFKQKYLEALKILLYKDLQKYITDGDDETEGYLYSNDLTIIIENGRDLFIEDDEIYENL